MNEQIGRRIQELRKLTGMTQEQLAEKINISRQTLSKWEMGTTMPDVDADDRYRRAYIELCYE